MTRVQLAGGPTAVLEIGGLRLLTDPNFDSPGSYPRSGGPTLVKLAPPAVRPDALGRVDAVLLSHDQHADNLDNAGRAFLAHVPLTLTTPSGAARLAADGVVVRGMAPWEHADLERADGGALRVTAVPARHGPEGCEPFSGEVTGFVLTGPELPTVYLSGDNAWLGAVEQVAERFGAVDVAVLFAGAARLPGAVRWSAAHPGQRDGRRGGAHPGRRPRGPRALHRLAALHRGRWRPARRFRPRRTV